MSEISGLGCRLIRVSGLSTGVVRPALTPPGPGARVHRQGWRFWKAACSLATIIPSGVISSLPDGSKFDYKIAPV